MTNHANNKLFGGVTIRIDTGSDIVSNYRNKIGGSSCMVDSDGVMMYRDNDEFSQLIITSGNSSLRAIVTKLDSGRFLMDRMYTDSEHLKQSAINYARKNNWLERQDGLNDSPTLYSDGEKIDDYSDIYVTLSNFDEDYVPYMDTLNRCEIGRSVILSHAYSDRSYDHVLNSTNGTLDEYTCEFCECSLNGDDVRYAGDHCLCDSCYCDNFFYCESCNEDCRTDDSVQTADGEYICDHCYSNHFFTCENCGDVYHDDDCNDAEGDSYCRDCFSDNCIVCEDCNEGVLIENSVSHGDCLYCEDCEGNHEEDE